MKRFAALLIAVIALVPLGAAAWPARPAFADKYIVKELKQLSGLKGVTVVGLNDEGAVVGTAVIRGVAHVFVIVGAGSVHPRLVVLPVPSGFHGMTAVGMNDMGWIVANGHARGKSGREEALVAGLEDSRYVWFTLPQSKTHGYQAVGIAPNGDVAGNRLGVGGRGERAVLWQRMGRNWRTPGSQRSPYEPPYKLNVGKGMRQSQAIGIWSRTASAGGRDVVVGEQYSGSPFNAKITVWNSGKSTFSVVAHTTMLFSNANAIGGWGSHLYIAGRVHGVDTGEGWIASIRWTRHGAVLGHTNYLTAGRFIGVECFYGANAVTAGLGGKFIAVGTIGCIGGNRGTVLLWRGNAVSNLQNQIQGGSGWHLTNAVAVNRNGQIIAIGTHNSKTGVLFLTH